MANTHFFATAAKGTESLVARELIAIGARNIRTTVGGVHFEGGLETLYRANLWLQTANRVLMPIAEFACPNPQALYENVRNIRWRDWMTVDTTFAVDCKLPRFPDLPLQLRRTEDQRCDSRSVSGGDRSFAQT